MIFNVFVYKRRRNSNTAYIVYYGNDNYRYYMYRVIHGCCPTKKVTYRILKAICAKTTHFTCIGQSEFENASFTYTLIQHYKVER